MEHGIIADWITNRGFGLIKPDAGGDYVFCHITMMPSGITPVAGMRVAYNIIEGTRSGKPRARDVQVLS
ncbi:cold-shock protein [Bradyrhizobium jicamae]|uniref:cold-shock protein n=1 Tax=Bradyrhizobium jicamae TaxID=280332 RepID=UPI001BA922E2|nr:cold shock domain-containing protein [Bradyrhizobium jicamae]MBR0937306.1 cold shock domain-containing protein [Bradyrhizobium jicamae]